MKIVFAETVWTAGDSCIQHRMCGRFWTQKSRYRHFKQWLESAGWQL